MVAAETPRLLASIGVLMTMVQTNALCLVIGGQGLALSLNMAFQNHHREIIEYSKLKFYSCNNGHVSSKGRKQRHV